MKENKKSSSHRDSFSASFSALVGLIPDSVIVVDGTRKIVAAIKMVGKCLGYEGEQFIGKSARGAVDQELSRVG